MNKFENKDTVPVPKGGDVPAEHDRNLTAETQRGYIC
jgi:hypothetical protein